jgi:hypothetical protein
MGLQGAGGLAAGGQALGGISDYFESKRQSKAIRTQGALDIRRSEREQRATTGAQIAQTGAAGIELEGSTLDLISATDIEFELDQAIIKESTDLARDATERAGKMALIGGLTGAAGTVAKTQQTSKLFQQRKQQQAALINPVRVTAPGMPPTTYLR